MRRAGNTGGTTIDSETRETGPVDLSGVAALRYVLRVRGFRRLRMALDIVTEVFRYSGGGAIYEKNILQQCLRDLNAAAQHLMVSEVSYDNLGQTLLGATNVNPMG